MTFKVSDGTVPIRVAEWLEKEMGLLVVYTRAYGSWSLRLPVEDGLGDTLWCFPWSHDQRPTLGEALMILASDDSAQECIRVADRLRSSK